jgi:spermidine synthase
MSWLFFFFCISGFCSILYEIIWLRLAMASFGVTSALVSIVLSVFMAGLGLGSWGSGYLIRRHSEKLKNSALSLYALTELFIGVSAILVPYELTLGRTLLERLGVSSSAGYNVASGLWVGLSLIPWCACMGATIPLAMLAIRSRGDGRSQRSFSYLYAANVLGATVGTIIPLLLIELRGFRGTLRVGAVLNVLLATSALLISRSWPVMMSAPSSTLATQPVSPPATPASGRLLALLLFGGLTSMGAEVVWIRQFTPYLGTMVYAFASILGSYLIATFLGSWFYRRWSRKHNHFAPPIIWALVGISVLLPLITADPSLDLWQATPKLQYFMGAFRVLVGIPPFCALLGFLTPMLIDRWSDGDPDRAGSAYAMNVIGCILGPLLSGFVLLPFFNERWVLFLFAVPWLIVSFNPGWWAGYEQQPGPVRKFKPSYVLAVLAVALVLITSSYESHFPKHVVLRDSTATVMAVGEEHQRDLLVNGRGMTGLAVVTKMMAHLPLAFLDHRPHNGLVVCFGMGTTFRSMHSWNIDTTAVELVPAVPRLFSYFHPDAPQILSSPSAHVEIDDGRRFLERTQQQFDVITIDPPPPIESAGSSLLYSKEFYSTIKQRLKQGGILQQWLPSGDKQVHAAIARALRESFENVRAFQGINGYGAHFLASDTPLLQRTPAELARQLPPSAAEDMVEWGPYPTPEGQFSATLRGEFPLDRFVAESPETPTMQDDRPVNEYFLLRLLSRKSPTTVASAR